MATTLEAISRAQEHKQGPGFRRHLGASVIGKECPRQLWYIFRWARRSYHSARLLRLFDRGNREEAVLVKLLRQGGVHVLDKNPDTGEQFRISAHEGHFGGSLDAQLFDTPEYPNVWVLGEFKTHGDKSFKTVVKQGVRDAKMEHFVQVQIYMHYENLPAALYFAVNKNDDDLFITTVEYDQAVAERYVDRAARIIYAKLPPPRINESPGWYLCKFCDYGDVCHHGQAKAVNCRTCVYAEPAPASEWICTRYSYRLSELDQRMGCRDYTAIPE